MKTNITWNQFNEFVTRTNVLTSKHGMKIGDAMMHVLQNMFPTLYVQLVGTPDDISSLEGKDRRVMDFMQKHFDIIG